MKTSPTRSLARALLPVTRAIIVVVVPLPLSLSLSLSLLTARIERKPEQVILSPGQSSSLSLAHSLAHAVAVDAAAAAADKVAD